MGQPRARRRQFLGLLAGATAGAGLAAGPVRAARAQGTGRGAPNGDADLILTNANVITLDTAAPRARAVAVKDDRILAVGSDDEMRALSGRATEVRDLRGLTLLPGFYDSHYHLLRAGISLADVDLSQTKTVADVLRAVGERAAITPPGAWVRTRSLWHEGQLQEQRFPTRWELDAVAPNNPVLMPRGGHNVVVNSRALELAGIGDDSPNPPYGIYVRDADGRLTGHIIESAAFAPIVRLVPRPTHEQAKQGLREIVPIFNSVGVTSVIDPGLPPDDMLTYQQVWEEGSLTLRANLMLRVEPGLSERELDQATATIRGLAFHTGFGNDWVKLSGIKMSIDGGVEANFIREPFAFTDDPEHPHGRLRISSENFEAVCDLANELGWQVGVHCVGDAAIDAVLAGFEAANAKRSIVGRRWTLHHMILPHPEHAEAVHRLGLVVAAQQPLMYSLALGWVKYWGQERAARGSPLRWYLDQGFHVGGGADVGAYPPLLGIWSCVTRETQLAGTLGGEWAITPAEALHMYTLGSAYVAFEEDRKGSITPGKLADLVVLGEDPLAVRPERLRDVEIVSTLVGGRLVYDRDQRIGYQGGRHPLALDGGCECG
jgi:predicted amidohydrolase YtcJ